MVRFHKTDGAHYITTRETNGAAHKQLVDSGADRELVGLRYAQKHKLRMWPLGHPIGIEFMNGQRGKPITHYVQETHRFTATNGTRRFKLKYLVADIPEGFVLGLQWLRFADPDVGFREGRLTWREASGVVLGRKARQRIIQGAIQANEPPEWVKRDFPEVLAPRPTALPPHRGKLDYRIVLKPGFEPRREKNRSFSPEERRAFADLAKEQADELGLWEISDSPQAVQMLWAAKAGATTVAEKRPCIDYRRLNEWIVDDAFPIPVIKDLMTDLAGKKYLTSLDLPKAYWSIRMADKETQSLAAFICNNTLYEPRVLQFGLKTAVAHFQRVITTVLGDVIGRGVHAYLDNIVLGADTIEEHDRLLRITLTRLRENGFSIQPKKCEWQKQEVQFCGFLVSNEGVRLDPEKLRAIHEWEPPRQGGALAKTKVREFLGFCNFYRMAVERYSEIAFPLTTLTGANAEWKWGPAEETAWGLLKAAILAAPILAPYDERLPIEVHTDASDAATAATVEHRYACGHTQPIAFFSKKLKKAEQNYTVHDKELLAIVQTFKEFHSWLHGSPEPVKVWSDHQALKHFLSTTKLTQRHARWAEILGEFRFSIQHVKGRENRAADALSRKDASAETAGGGVSPLKIEHFQPIGATYAARLARFRERVSSY